MFKTEIDALFTLAYNTPASFDAVDRPAEEFYTYASIGCAEPCPLYLPRHLRLVTSRPTKKHRRTAFDGFLTVASTVLRAAHEKTEKPRATPSPAQVMEGVRAQKAAEDNALRAFYEKNPALAALRAPPTPVMQLPTPPASPGSESDSLLAAVSVVVAAKPAPICLATPTSSYFNKREPQAPMTPPDSPTVPRHALSKTSRAPLQAIQAPPQAQPAPLQSNRAAVPSKIPRLTADAVKSPKLCSSATLAPGKPTALLERSQSRASSHVGRAKNTC